MSKEYIEREAVQKIIDYIRDKYCTYYNRGCKTTQFWWDTIRYFEKRIRALPAADVVEVVRCKNCEDSRPLKRERLPESIFRKECVWCRRFNTGMLPDEYCSYGKRKMDKEE